MNIKPNIEQLLSSNNIEMDTVREFGKTRYPQFQSNLNLIATAYLNSKGISTTPKSAGLVTVSKLVVDVYSDINVLVASKLNAQTYKGCPTCFKGLGRELQEGADAECATCGEVEVAIIYRPRYIMGDDTTEVIVKFGVTLKDDKDYTGKILKLNGKLTEYKGNIEFAAYKILSEETPTTQSIPETSSTPTEVTKDVPTSEATSGELTKEAQEIIDRLGQLIKLHASTGLVEQSKFEHWYTNQNKGGKVPLTLEQALVRLGYKLSEGKIIKK